MSPRPTILDHAALLAEGTRCRILQLVDGHELTVTELCNVLQLPQSTVSRHLKVLADGNWVESRRDGTSNLYRIHPQLEDSARNLWALFRSEIAESVPSRQDRHRLESVLAQRRSRSMEFFSATADRWDRMRDELFGLRFDAEAFLGLLDPTWVVGDLGCGTGRTTEMLAPFVAKVLAVDGSSAMLDGARARLAGLSNVVIKEGDLENLPLTDRSLDVAVILLTLHHVPDPPAVLKEVARVLKPSGRFLLVDMLPHGHEEYRLEMGHVWLGFSEERIQRELHAVGLSSIRVHALRPDPETKGPSLFAATSARPTLPRPAQVEDSNPLLQTVRNH